MEEQHSWNQGWCRDGSGSWLMEWLKAVCRGAGDTVQPLIFTHIHSWTFMRLQAYAETSCSNASLWCRNWGGRKWERLRYSLQRIQDGRGYQVAVWLNRACFIIRAMINVFSTDSLELDVSKTIDPGWLYWDVKLVQVKKAVFLYLAHMFVKG